MRRKSPNEKLNIGIIGAGGQGGGNLNNVAKENIVALFDVDHFKQFNDRYGHRAGDVILQEFARALMKDTRRSDIVCRFGGDY